MTDKNTEPPVVVEAPITGAELITAERARQPEEEGYTLEGDIGRADELLAAADCYLAVARHPGGWANADGSPTPPGGWPWAPEFWKPGTTERNLIKAGALIAAAIDARIKE